MRPQLQRARINVKLLIILVGLMGVLGTSAVAGHYVRKRVLADRALAAGKAALDAEDWPDACKQLRKYLEKYPDDEEILRRYAEAHLAVRPRDPNHVGAALGAYRRLRRLQPDDEKVSARLAKLYLGVGEFNEAAYISRERLDAQPDDIEAALVLGQAWMAQRKFAEAAERLKEFVEKYPSDPRLYVKLCIILLQDDSPQVRELISDLLALDEDSPLQNASQIALRLLDLGVERNPTSSTLLAQRAGLYRLALRNTEAARTDLQAAAELQPTDPEVLLKMYKEWAALGDLDRAAAQLQALEQLDATDLANYDIDSDLLNRAKFAAAADLVLRRRVKIEAIELAERMLQEAPSYDRVSFLPLAVELCLAGDQVETARQHLEEYQTAIADRRAMNAAVDARATYLEARVAFAEDKPYAVINLLEPVVRGDYEKRENWRLLARAYETTGQVHRVVRLLERYVQRWTSDLEATMQLANAYIKLQSWSNTLKYARIAESLAPGNPEAMLLRMQASIYARSNESASSPADQQLLQELAQLRRAFPDVTIIRTLLAQIAIKQGRTNDAITELTEAIEGSDNPMLLELQLADLYNRSDQKDKAIEACRATIERHADAAAPRLALAELQLANDLPAEARNTLTRAMKELIGNERSAAVYALVRYSMAHDEQPNAVLLLRQLASERTNDPEPRLALLGIPEIQDDLTRSQRFVDEIKAIESESGLRWRVEQAKLWLREENWQEREERQQQTIDLLTHCLERDPGWPTASLVLGQVYEMVDDNDKAEEIYRRSVDYNPRNLVAVSQLLAFLERHQRFADAGAILDRLPYIPLSLGLHNLNVALGVKDYSSAIEELERLTAANPNDAALRTLLARLIYAQKRDVGAALDLLDEVREISPDLLAALETRVRILHLEDRGQEAIALLKAEVDRRSDFAVYLLRAKYYYSIGEHDLAEEDYVHLTKFPESAAEGHEALGMFFQRLGEIDKAVAALEAGLRAVPETTALRIQLVKVLMAQADPEAQQRGRSMLDDLLGQFPDDPDLLLIRARVLLTEGTFNSTEEAMEILERVVQADPQNVEAHLRLMQFTGIPQDPAEVREQLARALRANPDHPDLLLTQAALESRVGNASAARVFAERILQEDPTNLKARLFLVGLDLRAGNTDSAQALNDQALAIDPENELARVTQARILTAKGLKDEAIQALESFRQTETGRDSVLARLALANFYLEENDATKAEELIDEAEERAPDAIAVLLARLRFWATQKRFDDIVARLNEGDIERPGRLPALTLGASFLAAAGEQRFLHEAEELYQRPIVLAHPSASSFLGLAQVKYLLGQFNEAEATYRKVLEMDPWNQMALNGLAWILGEDPDRLSEGKDYADQALRAYPDQPNLLDTRGVLLTRLGRLDDAREDLEKCLDAATLPSSTRAQALFHLGRVLNLQGDKKTAQQKLTEALDLDRQHDIFKPDERAEITHLLNSS